MVIEIPKIKSNPAFLYQPEFQKKNQDNAQNYVFDFIKDWLTDQQEFEFSTSGSTGDSKIIKVSRQVLTYSAIQTINFLNIKEGGNILLCIPPKFIGGSMVIVRALTNNMQLHVINPTLSFLGFDQHFKLASMVPAQIESIIRNDTRIFDHFDHILIGGAPLSIQTEMSLKEINTSCQFHITYGMTETASHIALRKPGEPNYRLLGDVIIKTDSTNCLHIKGTATNNNWIKTHDLVIIKDDHSFEWLGRADFVINSGGIKINPEIIEAKLSLKIKNKTFFITSMPHEVFGEQVILVFEGLSFEVPDTYFSDLSKYEVPKLVKWVPNFVYTDSGKLDKRKTKSLI